jgi:hypothetical protein
MTVRVNLRDSRGRCHFASRRDHDSDCAIPKLHRRTRQARSGRWTSRGQPLRVKSLVRVGSVSLRTGVGTVREDYSDSGDAWPGYAVSGGASGFHPVLDRRRAPVDCLARPLVTGWVAQSEIGVGAFMISSALATRDEAFGSPCCINTVDRTNGRYPLSEQDRGRPGPHPTSRTRSPARS